MAARSTSAFALAVAACFAWASCSDTPAATTSASGTSAPGSPVASDAAERARQEALDRDFPMHGLVTGLQISIRKGPSPDATSLGSLRVGSRVRAKTERTRTPTCATGWVALAPMGFACAGEGITLAETPPESELAVPAPSREAALPYDYYFIKDIGTPEYHQLPSRDQQRDVAAWRDRYGEILARDPAKALRFARGELPNEPRKPPILRGLLDRGFFVAVAAVETRAQRRFARTIRGRFIKDSQLEQRRGASFHGVELSPTATLPIAWAIRETRPMTKLTLPDGAIRFAEDREHPAIARLDLVPWSARERVDGKLLHKLADGRYVRDWHLAVAERIEPPFPVEANEPWVHVDRGEQTLVVYRGTEPIYATLVSTGLEGHETPLGTFTIRDKRLADTMSAIGADVENDRYSIEDVPWTQYFSGSFALHGAFWHERFGLRRSHGCVNLAPLDAHWVFNTTWPELPNGWHGITTDRTGLPASRVHITD